MEPRNVKQLDLNFQPRTHPERQPTSEKLSTEIDVSALKAILFELRFLETKIRGAIDSVTDIKTFVESAISNAEGK